MSECILEPEQYHILWRASFFSLATSLYAIYKGHYNLAFCPAGVFCTSINYWRHPDYSWRRYVDMTYVHLALLYQLRAASRSEYGNNYYAIMALGACCYQVGVVYFKKKDYWRSTYAHVGLHFIANVGNLVLYSGKIAGP